MGTFCCWYFPTGWWFAAVGKSSKLFATQLTSKLNNKNKDKAMHFARNRGLARLSLQRLLRSSLPVPPMFVPNASYWTKAVRTRLPEEIVLM